MYLKIKSVSSEASIYSQSEEFVKFIAITISFRVFSYFVVHFQSTSIKRLISQIYQMTQKILMLEYFNLKFHSIQKIGTSTIFSLISRRSLSFSEVIEGLLSSLLSNLILCFLLLYQISSFFHLFELIKMIGSLLLFSTIVWTVQYQRSLLRKYINSTSELANMQRIEILTSYEKTIAYGTIDSDLEEYAKRLKKHAFYTQIHNISFHLISLISGVFLLLFSRYFWKISWTDQSVSEINFSCLILATEKLKDTFFKLTRNFDTLIMNYSNFKYSLIKETDREHVDILKGSIKSIEKMIKIKDLEIKMGNKTIIQNTSLEIYKNKKIALFGINGSGKSSLIKAIIGFGDYSGSIKIDNLEVKDIPSSTLSQLISYVSQNIRIFNRSVLDNLKSGGTSKSDEEIFQICKQFGFESVFESIGYSKMVGENGSLVSGGQRQRIILLRAILRDADVLILDSAFTGLDQKTEQNFVQNLNLYLKNKTIICAVQNINILPFFEEIIYLNNGTLELGTLDELILKSQDFKKLIIKNEQKSMKKQKTKKTRTFKNRLKGMLMMRSNN